jgi:hypothetical protein
MPNLNSTRVTCLQPISGSRSAGSLKLRIILKATVIARVRGRVASGSASPSCSCSTFKSLQEVLKLTVVLSASFGRGFYRHIFTSLTPTVAQRLVISAVDIAPRRAKATLFVLFLGTQNDNWLFTDNKLVLPEISTAS